MNNPSIIKSQITTNVNNSRGFLRIFVTSETGAFPIPEARVTLFSQSSPENPLISLLTDESGQTSYLSLPAPDPELSLEPEQVLLPYSQYIIQVTAAGYESVTVSGTEILADETALLQVRMHKSSVSTEVEMITIPDHTLYGNYPSKIPEAEIKPTEESGEIVLSKVVIPEYIIVHDGLPSNSSAPNYYVSYKDYIKNVASSEIYATWPEAAIYANILAIQSFTLNRVYTEWYRNQGYDFTITSSTAYDHKWIYGRNIFSTIDRIVDSIFANYLSRPGVRQPIFTSYCDGQRVTCNGLSQWGSKYLADEGYRAIEILRYYYGNDMYINTATEIEGIPSSFPGTNLTIGSTGQKVQQMQEQLNRIARNYPALPTISADGIYGPLTAESVRVFQRIFDLPQTGVVDYPTWYEISSIYVGVSQIAEPN